MPLALGACTATDTFDGSVALVFRGKLPAVETTLAIDMRYRGSDADLDLDSVAVTLDPTTASVTLDGSGSVSAVGASFSADAGALTWSAGEYPPSSGDVIVTFLATTPGACVVSIQVGTLPAFEQQLFKPLPVTVSRLREVTVAVPAHM